MCRETKAICSFRYECVENRMGTSIAQLMQVRSSLYYGNELWASLHYCNICPNVWGVLFQVYEEGDSVPGTWGNFKNRCVATLLS